MTKGSARREVARNTALASFAAYYGQEPFYTKGYAQAREVFLASSKAVPIQDPDPNVQTLRNGALVELTSSAHTQRRRALSVLLRRRGHQRYRDSALFPTVDKALAEVLHADGRPQMDLVSWAVRVFLQVAAALVGLDNAKTEEGAAALADLARRFSHTVSGFSLARGDIDAQMRSGLAAKQEFVETFYRPAFEARLALVTQLEAGDIDEAALPDDILTLIAAVVDPKYAQDPDLGVRETIVMLNAAVMTSVTTLVEAVDELLCWFDAHPEDRALRADEPFLLRGFEEALRLSTVNVVARRKTVEELTLASGQVVGAGRIIAIDLYDANRDASVFGDDADTFNPYRAIPQGVPNYGVAFGAGPHMCYGLPIVLGNEGIDGSSVYVLKALFAAGMERDPFHASMPPPTTSRELFGTYPVVFDS